MPVTAGTAKAAKLPKRIGAHFICAILPGTPKVYDDNLYGVIYCYLGIHHCFRQICTLDLENGP